MSKKIRFYKSINPETGYEKYIQTSEKACIVVVFGGAEPKIKRFRKPYPDFTEELLEPCTCGEFYEKLDSVRQKKLQYQ
jgi:hypothetical protein